MKTLVQILIATGLLGILSVLSFRSYFGLISWTEEVVDKVNSRQLLYGDL